jgi:hypothetical protein
MSKASENAARYEGCRPKALGNLHERLKFVVECGRAHGLWETHRELWNAILDLEVEAKHYTPARPPHGRRPA